MNWFKVELDFQESYVSNIETNSNIGMLLSSAWKIIRTKWWKNVISLRNV